jgi:hypothetical protein
MIERARVESELDYWFRSEPPACSVLWLLGGHEDLVAAMVALALALAPLECRAASCRAGSPPGLLAGVPGCEVVLEARLQFAGSAIDATSSPIVRHVSSRASVCEVACIDTAGQVGLWDLLSSARGLRLCVGLFPGSSQVPDSWIYSAARLALAAGTNLLRMGSRDPEDGLLHGFLADTLRADGIAVIKGGLELASPGLALTGLPERIDQVEHVLGGTRAADDTLVRRSVQLAGPWSTAAYRGYRYQPDTNRWAAGGP